MRISDWSSDVCSSDLRQRKGLGDARRDPALAPQIEQVRDMALVGRRIARGERPPEHAAHVAALEQREVERQPRNPGGEADDQIAPFPPDRAQGRLGIIAAQDRKSTPSELQSLMRISYAVFCLKKKIPHTKTQQH